MEKIFLDSDFIRLDQFLKWQNLCNSGAAAKFFITAGKVRVNEEIELRRGRKLFPGDYLTVAEKEYQLEKRK